MSVFDKTSNGDSSIRATSIATLPCPIIAIDSPVKSGWKFSVPGKPLYQATNSLADNTLVYLSSFGMPSFLSFSAPYDCVNIRQK